MSEVIQRIAAEIKDAGAISFARFMEIALYCPNFGYYERERDIIGRRGDYYTSVSVGSLFGELLACQFAEWLPRGGTSPGAGSVQQVPGAPQIVEAGAHQGDLAKDILSWLAQHRPSLFGALTYTIVEPSVGRRRVQQQRLHEFGRKLRWVESLTELVSAATAGSTSRNAGDGVYGVIFANELLDAMPVHRFGWAAKSQSWFEWGVTVDAGRFVWTQLADPDAVTALMGQAAVCNPFLRAIVSGESGSCKNLPDGFTTEWSPAAEQWWRSAASVLNLGKLVTIDYGLTADEFFAPERKDGTLRAYRSHCLSGDVLACPGQQDITAQVNFTVIQSSGEAMGLKTDLFQSQARFLTGIAGSAWTTEASLKKRSMERTRQFHTLTHPDFLGHAFRVLVQSRP